MSPRRLDDDGSRTHYIGPSVTASPSASPMIAKKRMLDVSIFPSLQEFEHVDPELVQCEVILDSEALMPQLTESSPNPIVRGPFGIVTNDRVLG